MNKEIWKDIPNYEGLYQISNLGNVKSLSRYKQNHNKKQIVEEKIRKNIISKTGYYTCMLNKNGKNKLFKVHRLVALVFIDNPNNLPIVNHIDGNKLNNNYKNLEWCTYSHNNKEAYRLGLKGNEKDFRGLKKYNEKLKKEILQYDLNCNFIKKWNSISEIQKELGYATTNISKCCKGKYNKAYNYIWEYSGNNEE